MKQRIIAGNWKSNKGVSDAKAFMNDFHELWIKNPITDGLPEIILFVPFSDLYPMKQMRDELAIPISLGAQDISPYPEGAYTGEVSAKMIQELASWVLIGHSERRNLLEETDEQLYFEVKQAKSANLKIIYCVSDATMSVPGDCDVIGYEPLWAIGTGKTDTPENAQKVLSELKKTSGITKAVYGGSITADNVASFVSQEAIDGVLVGGASLDPGKLYTLIRNAI